MEIIPVVSQNQAKHVNMQYWLSAEFLNIKPRDTLYKCWAVDLKQAVLEEFNLDL